LVLEAASDHGPTALFGGLSRTLDVDREEMAGRFRRVLEDITSGAFARRFQEEAERGYPMLEVARALMAMTDAEARLRQTARMVDPWEKED
jgi:ketol-acid reductoisomerase